MIKINFFIILYLFGAVSRAQAELFSALTAILPLLDTQQRMIQDVDSYFVKERRRLNVIIRHFNHLTEHNKMMKVNRNFCKNPVNCFTLNRRLTKDLDFIESLIAEINEYEMDKTTTFPTHADLRGTAQTLAHVQETYLLNVTELANGILNANFRRSKQAYTELFAPMTASDCFVFGFQLYELQYFKLCSMWMTEVSKKFKTEDDEVHFFSEEDIVSVISYAYYSLGDIKNTLQWTKGYLSANPDDSIQTQINENSVLGLEERLAEEDYAKEQKMSLKLIENYTYFQNENEIYVQLCRGEISIPNEINRRLQCRYQTESHPFLTLARVKVEQLYLQPEIILFHDVISDREIEHLQKVAIPRLERGKYAEGKKEGTSLNLVYQSAYLEDEESEVIARISQRISQFTGLDASRAQALQVANYGIAGHFSPHYDYATTENSTDGNSIATVLFYMSDVAQGGATIFPHLGLSVYPVKRAALFWRNLLPSGVGDRTTRHSSCPVLRGSKWVSNKWIFEHGQEFTKPCELNNQENRITIDTFPLSRLYDDDDK